MSQNSTPVHSVFYVTGMYGKLETGLGVALTELEVRFTGIEHRGEFLRLSFKKRLEVLAEKLKSFEQQGGKKLVAVSAGGHLILTYLLQHNHPNLDVLLLSPVIGKTYLLRSYLLRDPNSVPGMCRRMRLVTGTYDYVCPICYAKKMVDLYQDISFNPIESATHHLPHEVVRDELRSFLNN
jgi:hypothetical protein